MRLLLIGKHGQVGWELNRALAPLGEVIALGRDTLDLSDTDAIPAVINDIKPSVIVNAAAYTAVDKAEQEPEAAHNINAIVPEILGRLAQDTGALLVHYSTDYVFDGASTRPYREADEPGPLNEYGKSKLAGERAVQDSQCAHLIFRTSWVFGNRGSNFLNTMGRLANERDELKIVSDQTGAPTWSRMLAQASAMAIYRYLENRPTDQSLDGIYHVTSAGRASWYEFAQAIIAGLRQAGEKTRVTRVLPIATREYPVLAQRPTFSVLNNDKFATAFGIRMPPWEQALRLCVEERGSTPQD